MIRATQEQAFQRWETLPETIREALFEPQNAALVEKICAEAKVSGAELKAVSTLVSYVFFGFLREGELADEIAAGAKLQRDAAQTLANNLRKVFDPYRKELERLYAPPGTVLPAAAAPAPAEEESDLPFTFAPKPIGGGLAAGSPPAAPFPAAKPAPAASSGGPGPAPFSAIPAAGPAAAPAPVSAAASPAPLGQTAGPAPMFMREENAVKPIQQKSGFRLAFPSVKFKDVKTEQASSSARIEAVGISQESAPKTGPARTEMPSAKVVHYSQWRTPVPSNAAPVQPAGLPEKKEFQPVPLAHLTNISPNVPAAAPRDPFASASATPPAPRPEKTMEFLSKLKPASVPPSPLQPAPLAESPKPAPLGQVPAAAPLSAMPASPAGKPAAAPSVSLPAQRPSAAPVMNPPAAPVVPPAPVSPAPLATKSTAGPALPPKPPVIPAPSAPAAPPQAPAPAPKSDIIDLGSL